MGPTLVATVSTRRRLQVPRFSQQSNGITLTMTLATTCLARLRIVAGWVGLWDKQVIIRSEEPVG